MGGAAPSFAHYQGIVPMSSILYNIHLVHSGTLGLNM